MEFSRRELVRHLEEQSGRQLRTRAEVASYIEELRAAEAGPAARRWETIKHITLIVLLGLAALQYYVLDVLVQIASLPQLTFFVG